LPFRLVIALGNLLSAVMGAAMPLTANFSRHPRAPELARRGIPVIRSLRELVALVRRD